MSTDNRDEQGRFQSPTPDESGPDWDSLGVDFETARNAVNMQRQFENVNTRADAYRTLYDPRFDAGIVQFVQPEQEEPEDEWAHLRGEQEYDEPQYRQPPPPDFDIRQLPDMLGPVLDQRDARLFNAWQVQQQMDAQRQAVEHATAQAASAAGLPDFIQAAIQRDVNDVLQSSANRRPDQVAGEITQRYVDAMRSAQVAAVPPPAAPGPPSQDSPVAGERQPKDFEEAAQWMRDNLPPGP